MHHSGGADNVAIVYLSELDGEALDRTNQAALLDRLNEAGAQGVVHDLIFDRQSKDPEIDRQFAAAILRFRGVDENGDPVPGATRRSVFLACGRETISQTGAVGERLIPPTDALLGVVDEFGLVALVCDDKYVVRELGVGTPDEPSLVWKAALAHNANLTESERLFSKWINYAAAHSIAAFSATDLLQSDDLTYLRGKMVVVGGLYHDRGRRKSRCEARGLEYDFRNKNSAQR